MQFSFQRLEDFVALDAVWIWCRKRVARSLVILLDKTDRPILPQSIALRLSRAPKRSSDTRRARMALRTVEPERRARTASETSKGRRRYARWGILLAHSNLSPTAMASARSQRVSLAETSKDMSGEQLSRRARGLQRARRRRNWRCRWRSKSGKTFTLMWDTFCARAVAKCVAFPGGDARAPAEIVVLPANSLSGKNGGRSCICARNLEVLTPEPSQKEMSSLSRKNNQ